MLVNNIYYCRKKRATLQFRLAFRSICTISDFIEGTLAREIPNKIWFSPRLVVPLPSPKIGCISELQRKYHFSLVFRSICTTFDFVESTLARENPNKIWFSTRLIVPLASPKIGCTSFTFAPTEQEWYKCEGNLNGTMFHTRGSL